MDLPEILQKYPWPVNGNEPQREQTQAEIAA
jgi:hypothetical protein